MEAIYLQYSYDFRDYAGSSQKRREIQAMAQSNSPTIPTLPAALGRLQAGMLEWLPGEPLMSRDNLDSMKVANVASVDRPGLARLGIRPSAVEAIAPIYPGLTQGPGRREAWRAGAHRR